MRRRAVVAGATVLKNTGTGYSARSRPAPGGVCSARHAGRHVHRRGDRAERCGEEVRRHAAVGATETLTLTIGGVQVTEEITVSARTVSIDVSEAAASTSIAEEAIADLPARGRNFPDFVLLTPSVIQESDRSGLVISGQRSINSNVSIDGADFNDPLQGNQRGGNEGVFFFPQAAVEEFQVVRAGATASVGRTAAGFVNVVTKSGTNALPRRALLLQPQPAASPRPTRSAARSTTSRTSSAAPIGGPIAADKAHFFVAAEQNFLRVPFVTEFQHAAGRRRRCPPSSPPSRASTTGPTTRPRCSRASTCSSRPTHRLNVQYTYSRLRGENFNFDSPPLDQAEQTNYLRTTTSHGAKAHAGVDVRDQPAERAHRRRSGPTTGWSSPTSRQPQIVDRRLRDARRRRRTAPRVRGHPLPGRGQPQRPAREAPAALRRSTSTSPLPDRSARATSRAATTSARWPTTRRAGSAAIARPSPPSTPPTSSTRRSQRELGFYAQDRATFGAVTRGRGPALGRAVEPVAGRGRTPRCRRPPRSRTTSPCGSRGWAWPGRPAAAARTVVRATAGIYAARTPANLFQRVFTDNGLATVAVDSKVDKSVLGYVTFPNALTALPPGVKVAPPQVFGFDPGLPEPAGEAALGGRRAPARQGRRRLARATSTSRPTTCSAGSTATSSRPRSTRRACRSSRRRGRTPRIGILLDQRVDREVRATTRW